MVGPRFPRDMRGHDARHNRQLLDRRDGSQPPFFNQSGFCLVYTYNVLPQTTVDITDLSKFQHASQQAVRLSFVTGIADWPFLFHDNF